MDITMTGLDALRSLQEQASPGPWSAPPEGQRTKYVYGGAASGGYGYAVFARSPNGTMPRVAWFDAIHSEMANDNRANAKLAALAPHLLPIAEVVHCSHDHNAGTEECLESDACTVPCPQCKALKDLMEALE